MFDFGDEMLKEWTEVAQESHPGWQVVESDNGAYPDSVELVSPDGSESIVLWDPENTEHTEYLVHLQLRALVEEVKESRKRRKAAKVE